MPRRESQTASAEAICNQSNERDFLIGREILLGESVIAFFFFHLSAQAAPIEIPTGTNVS